MFADSDFDFYVRLCRDTVRLRPGVELRSATKLLQKCGKFATFLQIPQARVPILKCFHIRTGYQCDINFSDSLGAFNSEIVARILALDPRIHLLTIIVKYWAKVHKCAGKLKLSNYAIVWMVVFYLQQLPVPILPPISEFQKRVPAHLVEGKNFAFDDSLEVSSENRMRYSELLLGFFKFYQNINNYDACVMSPLHGKLFRKSDPNRMKIPEFQSFHQLCRLKNLPIGFNKPISIQDPFDITRTVPGKIVESEYKKITWKFACASDLIEEELNRNPESSKFLKLLFDEEIFNQYVRWQERMKGPAVLRDYAAPSQRTLFYVIATDDYLSIVRRILSKTSVENLNEEAVHQSWAEQAVNFVTLILQDIFMLTENNDGVPPANTLSESIGLKKQTEKPATFSRTINLIGCRDVFDERKQITPINENSLSAAMRDSQKRNKKSRTINLKTIVKINTDTKTYNKITVEFEDLINTRRHNYFRQFRRYFEENLDNLLKVYFLQKRV